MNTTDQIEVECKKAYDIKGCIILPTTFQSKLLIGTEGVCIVIVLIFMSFIAHNIYYFVIKQRRYNTMVISAFYISATLIQMTRLSMYFDYMHYDIANLDADYSGKN